MKSILIVNKYFYPGYKAGGPIQSLKNMCDVLLEEFSISVLAWDRDFMDDESYSSFRSGEWNVVDGCNIFYAKNKTIDRDVIGSVVHHVQPDLIYFNSFFDKISIMGIIVAKRLNIPILLAPRGEFNSGALQIKNVKKRIFLKLSKMLGLYDGVVYHATNEYEKNDIVKVLGTVPLFISQNFVKRPLDRLDSKCFGDNLRLVYISRVSPKKNLLFFINCLRDIEFCGKIFFDIYGPIDDEKYWQLCRQAINSVKATNNNIAIEYKGAISPYNQTDIYKKANFSVLPTLGENFGHSIYESLAHGVPVIISDQTPWRRLESLKAGFDLGLNSNEFCGVFSKIELMDNEGYLSYCDGALNLAKNYYNSLDVNDLKDNLKKVMM